MEEVNAATEYPTLILPKKCTTLETSCESSDNLFMCLNITTPDTHGIISHVYDGFCNVKLIDSYETRDIERLRVISPIRDVNDIEQMPIILSDDHLSYLYNDSQVWIDPSRSPFVYNHYDMGQQERYTFHENHITLEQHNTYITQNVYTSNHSPVRRRPRKETHKPIYNEDEYDSFLTEVLSQEERCHKEPEPQPPKKGIEDENSALLQLMSTDVKKKQRKTISFLGNNSNSGQTIQNISYNDPMVECAKANMKVTLESSRKKSLKKIYQCDKCKQIFATIPAFRQHMVGSTSNQTTKSRPESFLCIECGRNLKTEAKFEKHVLGHGNPDLECPKCHKVYATKATLKAHQKLHNRKYHCKYCTKTFDKAEGLKTHVKKIHLLYICNRDKCEFITENVAQFEEHKEKHRTQKVADLYDEPECVGEIEVVTEEELKSENVIDKESQISDNNNNDAIISSRVFFDEDFIDQDIIEEVFQSDNLNESSPRRTRNSSKKMQAESSNDDGGEKMIDSVLAKVMSNKFFLLNSKTDKKHSKYNKTCEVCFKTFDRIADLKRHLIEHVIRYTLKKSPVSHDGMLKMLCAVCHTEAFSELSKYKNHLREHAKLTLYKCTICDKSFSDSSNFSKHKKIHGDDHYQCDLCKRKFNSEKMMTQHKEYHSKNDKIKCKFCNQKFYFASMLNKHMKNNHAKSSKARYACRFCDGSFLSLRDKWDHEWLVHSVRKNVFDCEICTCKFRKYSELKRHYNDTHRASILTATNLRKKGRH